MLEKLANIIYVVYTLVITIYLLVANILGFVTYATVTYQLFQHRDYVGCVVWVLFVGHIISLLNGMFWPISLYLGLK